MPRLFGALTVVAAVTTVSTGPAVAGTASPVSPVSPESPVPTFQKRYAASVYGDFTTIGNTVLGCPADPRDAAARCTAATSGTGAAAGTGGAPLEEFEMRRLDTARMSSGHGSSTGRITVPPRARVTYARLFWGGNDGTYRAPNGILLNSCDGSGSVARLSPGDPLKSVPSIRVDRNKPVGVIAENLVRDPDSAPGAHYYTGEADVTGAFARVVGTGKPLTVAVGGVWAPAGRGCAAGWSLSVVYAYDAPDARFAPERRTVQIYGGHALQRPGAPATTVPANGFHRSAGQIRASVTAYGGDRNRTGDRFRVDGRDMTGPDTGSADNFFAGVARGAAAPGLRDNLSIDAKDFALPDDAIRPGARSATLSFETDGDSYVPSALALSVPVPDLEITKSASAESVAPGGTVTFTITAKNTGRRDYPGVRFTDDLADTLDDAVYDGNATASLGTVGYAEPVLSYSGDIPAGKTATITYSVTVDGSDGASAAAGGNGRLGSNLSVASPRSNCGTGSADALCSVAPVVEEAAELEGSQADLDEESHDDSLEQGREDEPEQGGDAGEDGDDRAAGGRHGSTGVMAATGHDSERLWLLGGVALALSAAGAIALAATRDRGNH
ncbi:hypothetical protein [Streptomyces sp. MS1.AVA.4]|uniref:Uncharacterized protein n=1 Tax=Streptomyces pratisoli TaxID=3139917 RepID=A0ACC6QIA9_9ACTN